MQPHDIQRITHLLPFLSTVSQPDWDRAELIHIDTSTPHSIREGHSLQHAMFMIRGSIRIYKISEQGREITLYRVKSGQSCVLMMASVLGETEYEASASIEVESEVLLIPVDLFRQWMDNYKPLRQFIYKQFIHRISDVSNLLENIAFNSIQDRLAHYIYINTNEQTAIWKITHDQLAIELGTAREVISRTLQSFQQAGILSLHRGKIHLLNRSALEKMMNQRLT
ncbi:Global nitrogen regulator [compost metagenome]